MPVLLIVFNRPDTTRQVFGAIRCAQPRQLFVAADGPREGVGADEALCAAARRVATAVDWDCDVQTLFREGNLGCGLGPSLAISWFFDNVEAGIIFEDDCVPQLTGLLGRDASRLLKWHGLEMDSSGDMDGCVGRQSIAPGQKVKKKTVIKVTLAPTTMKKTSSWMH